MPIFAWLHNILHGLTGGLDCLIILLLFLPYFIYRKFIKKDWSLEKFFCHNKKCKHNHKPKDKS